MLDDLAPRAIPDAELLGGGDTKPPFSTTALTPTTKTLLAPLSRAAGDARLRAFARHPAVVALRGNAKAAVAFAPRLRRDLREVDALVAEAASCLGPEDSDDVLPSFWRSP